MVTNVVARVWESRKGERKKRGKVEIDKVVFGSSRTSPLFDFFIK
jgi:hypothetical protein